MSKMVQKTIRQMLSSFHGHDLECACSCRQCLFESTSLFCYIYRPMWRAILTHVSAITMYINHFASNWLNYTLLVRILFKENVLLPLSNSFRCMVSFAPHFAIASFSVAHRFCCTVFKRSKTIFLHFHIFRHGCLPFLISNSILI